MSTSTRLQFAKKRMCPCGKSASYCPVRGHEHDDQPYGKCWSDSCQQKFFPLRSADKPTVEPPESSAIISRREHEYLTLNGEPHMLVRITKRANGKKDVYSFRREGGEWIPKINGIENLPYQLPDLRESIGMGRTILVLEGEKDVDRAQLLGFAASSNQGGAGKWTDSLSGHFDGANVVVIADNDPIGHEHAKQVRTSLLEHGGVLSAEILDLRTLMTDLPEKGDLSDYVDLGGSVERLRTAVESIVAKATPPSAPICGIPLPTFYPDQLPIQLHRLIEHVEDKHQRFALLASAIVAIGGVLPNVVTEYHGNRFSPALYLFVAGPPGSGKSSIIPSLQLVMNVDKELQEQSKRDQTSYQEKCERWKSFGRKNGEPHPTKPERKQFLVPADSTAPVIVRALCGNDCCLLFDSEADTLATAMRPETGDVSSTLRKAWQGERISEARVGGDLYASTDHPHISIIISGTTDQISGLVKHVENGLTSRFAFIEFHGQPTFRNPFLSTHARAYTSARELAHSIHDMWKFNTRHANERQFLVELTKPQQMRFMEHFSQRLHDQIEAADQATTLRAGIVAVRIATVLTCLRVWEERTHLDEVMMVRDEDFETSIVMAEFFRLSTDSIVTRLSGNRPSKALPPRKRKPLEWFEQLPNEFTTQQAITQGQTLTIARATVHKYLNDESRFERIKQGSYRKVNPAATRAP